MTDAISRASAVVDQGVLRMMERSMRGAPASRPPKDARARLIELAEQYNTPETLAVDSPFFPAPVLPLVTQHQRTPRWGADRIIDLSFPSGYQPFLQAYEDEYASYGANLMVRARFYGGEHPRPVVICIHGWGGGNYWVDERAFVVEYLLRIGLDVVLFQLPFHGDRTPEQASRSGALFPSANVVRTSEAFGQAIYDLRSLALFLRARGAPSIGVAGMSLGGYTSALWASLDSDLSFAIPMIPAVSMSALMWRHGSKSPARRRARRLGVEQSLLDDAFAVHAPLSRPARIAKERLLIVGGKGDRITPPDQAVALWEHWEKPSLHWFPGGHLAQIGRGNAFRTIRKHLIDLAVLGVPAR